VLRRFHAKFAVLAARFHQLASIRLHWNRVCGAFFAYLILGVVNGTCCWLLIRAVSPDIDVPFSAAVAANSLAWLAGFFAVFAPAGLGVREGTFVVLLAPWLPLETGLVAAALWRFALIVAELACLAPMVVGGNANNPAMRKSCEVNG
jgi:uncharacterized membrane protein YbhN (UPF0104 family)